MGEEDVLRQSISNFDRSRGRLGRIGGTKELEIEKVEEEGEVGEDEEEGEEGALNRTEEDLSLDDTLAMTNMTNMTNMVTSMCSNLGNEKMLMGISLEKEERVEERRRQSHLIDPSLSSDSTVRRTMEIPLLPRGLVLTLEILTTWGDPHYVGLSSLEIFDGRGHPITEFDKIEGDDINSLGVGGGDPRTVDKLVSFH